MVQQVTEALPGNPSRYRFRRAAVAARSETSAERSRIELGHFVRLFDFLTKTEDPGYQRLPRTGDTATENTKGTETKQGKDRKGMKISSFCFECSRALCPSWSLWFASTRSAQELRCSSKSNSRIRNPMLRPDAATVAIPRGALCRPRRCRSAQDDGIGTKYVPGLLVRMRFVRRAPIWNLLGSASQQENDRHVSIALDE